MGSINWTDVLKGATAFFLVIAGVGMAYVCVRLGGLLARLGATVGAMTDEVVPILTRAQTTVDGINLELVRVDDIMVTAVNATKGAEKTVSSISGAVTAPVRKASGLAAMAKEALATFRTRRVAGPDEAEQRAHVAAETPAVEEVPPTDEARAAEAFRAAASAGGERFRAAVAPTLSRAEQQVPATPAAASPAPLRSDPFAAHIRSEPADPHGSVTGELPAIGGADEQIPVTRPATAAEGHRDASDGAAGHGARRRGPSLSQIAWALPKRTAR